MAVVDQPVEVSEHERLKIAGLEWVNGVRVARGAEPLAELPPGFPRSLSACTLARAAADVIGDLELLPVPPPVHEFMRRFDAGEYPELIAPELLVC